MLFGAHCVWQVPSFILDCFLGCPHTLQSHKPEPSNPASITLSVMQGESNMHWSWLDLACETRYFGDCQVSLWLSTVQTKHDNSQQKQDISQWNRWWNHTSNWTHLLINSPTHQNFRRLYFSCFRSSRMLELKWDLLRMHYDHFETCTVASCLCKWLLIDIVHIVHLHQGLAAFG